MCAYVPCAIDVILLCVFGSLSLDAHRRREREMCVPPAPPGISVSCLAMFTLLGPYPCVLQVVAVPPNT